MGYVERDAHAASVLLARMENATLDPAPIWCGDVAKLDPSPFFGVDAVTAGFPCQPFSSAGKRRGLSDERWIWPAIAEIVRAVGPRLVLLENVPGVTRHGLAHVLGSLAEVGIDAEWDLFRAEDVGAPHRRERWFCLAYSDGERREGVRVAKSFGQQGARRNESNGRDAFPFRWPPGPDSRLWEDIDPGAQPAIRRVVDGVPSGLDRLFVNRSDRLRVLGNAVVPDVAELAFRVLWERMHGCETRFE